MMQVENGSFQFACVTNTVPHSGGFYQWVSPLPTVVAQGNLIYQQLAGDHDQPNNKEQTFFFSPPVSSTIKNVAHFTSSNGQISHSVALSAPSANHPLAAFWLAPPPLGSSVHHLPSVAPAASSAHHPLVAPTASLLAHCAYAAQTAPSVCHPSFVPAVSLVSHSLVAPTVS